MAWKSDHFKVSRFYSGLRLFPAIMLLVCAMFLATTSQAASSDLLGCAGRDRSESLNTPRPYTPDFKVETLFGGRYRDGDWATIRVKLHNGSQPWQGEVCAILPYNPDSTYAFNRTINLAAGADTSFLLYILPSRFEPRFDVLLYNAAGQQVAQDSVRLQLTGTADYTVGVVSEPDKLGSNYLPRLGTFRMRQSNLRLVFVPVSPADLPDRSSGFDTFDAMLLGNLDPAHLSPVQWRALTGWLEEGGQLWLPGGASYAALAGALDPAIVPANSQGTLQLSRVTARHLPDSLLPAVQAANGQKLTVQNLVVSPGSVVATRQEGSEANGLPLVVGRAVGRGAIVATAFDLLAAPFTEPSDANSRYWGAVAEAANPGPDYSNLKQDLFGQPAIPRQIASEPPQDLPDPFWIIVGMIAYVVIAVPGCYLLFNKIERPLLALPIIPLFAIVLGAGMWWAGMAISAKPVHLNRVAIVSFSGENIPAGIKTFGVSVGSGSMDYKLAINNLHSSDQGTIYRPQNLVIPNQQWRTSPPQMLTQDILPSAGIVQSNFNPDGQLQAFGGQGAIDLRFPVETNLAILPDGSGISGTITNSSRWNLSDVTLVLGDNYLYLGNLSASEVHPVNFSLKTKPNFLPRISIEPGLYGSTPITNNSTVNNETDDRWRRNLHWTFLNAAYLNGRFSSLYQSYNLYLTGWLDGSAATDVMGAVNLDQGRPLREQDSVLLIRPLSFSYLSYQSGSDNRVVIPAASLTSFRLSANETTATTEGNVRLAPNGNLVMQYRLPIQAALQPTRLSVLVKSGRDQRGAPQSNPQLEIYNWEQQKWEVISNAGDNRERIDLIGPNVGGYVDRSGGFVRLRASSQSEVYILQQLNIELEGSKQ